jgi:DNA-binding transcriptional MerR regulator
MSRFRCQAEQERGGFCIDLPLRADLRVERMAHKHRRLTIGEYAAATQLTAKALRLYDEQGLIKPSVVDPASGYRYYHSDQVPTGRLVRALRDMDLSLAQIGHVLDAPMGSRPALLRNFLFESEQRLARERHAYQLAILMLRSQTSSHVTPIDELAAPEERVALFGFLTNRRSFVEHALQHRSLHLASLQSARTRTQADCAFALLEPLTDEDTRVELAIPIDAQTSLSNLTTRLLPSRRYASVLAQRGSFLDGFTSSTDALFDWFDKKGVHAVGHPEIVLRTDSDELHACVRWEFSPHQDN